MLFVVFFGFQEFLTELRSEKFEWFGPSPIEPLNLREDDQATAQQSSAAAAAAWAGYVDNVRLDEDRDRFAACLPASS